MHALNSILKAKQNKTDPLSSFLRLSHSIQFPSLRWNSLLPTCVAFPSVLNISFSMKPYLMNIYEYVPAVFIQCVDFPSQQAAVLHFAFYC